jgi:hypothetical protein
MDIVDLRALSDRLSRIDFSAAQSAALRHAASTISANVREVLSQPPGNDHGAPWLRTGALRDSIACENDESSAVIGSTSDVAGEIAAAVANALAGVIE